MLFAEIGLPDGAVYALPWGTPTAAATSPVRDALLNATTETVTALFRSSGCLDASRSAYLDFNSSFLDRVRPTQLWQTKPQFKALSPDFSGCLVCT